MLPAAVDQDPAWGKGKSTVQQRPTWPKTSSLAQEHCTKQAPTQLKPAGGAALARGGSLPPPAFFSGMGARQEAHSFLTAPQLLTNDYLLERNEFLLLSKQPALFCLCSRSPWLFSHLLRALLHAHRLSHLWVPAPEHIVRTTTTSSRCARGQKKKGSADVGRVPASTAPLCAFPR